MSKLLAKWIRGASKVFCEELSQHYPATLFSNRLDISPQRSALAHQDRVLLECLRNKHLGQRCFIIGNGPSLTVDDLNRLRFEYTFASNKIYLLFDQTQWRPTYYSCEDTLVIQQNADKILDLDRTLKIFPSNILEHVERKDGCYFCEFINHPELLEEPPSFERQFSYDLTRGLHWGSTITYSLIQMAVFMGFKDVYLLGVDHLYVTPRKKKGSFYISEGEVNHFNKEYRALGEKWHEPRLDVLERSYEYALMACEKVGVSLYNASRRTALDVFEQIDLDKVL